MEVRGLSTAQARQNIWMMDIDGLLAKGRPEGGIEGQRAIFAKDHAPIKDLHALVREIKPSVIIGTSSYR